jgi:ribulose-phosphate 3-epimerase
VKRWIALRKVISRKIQTFNNQQSIYNMPLLAPSLLTADFLHLESECKMLNESKADWFHLDIMDGRFVPNISFGMSIVKQIRKTTTRFFDVHLMILEPGKYVEEFKDAGANSLTVHLEVCPHLHRNIQQIKSLGMNAGVALNPSTPVFLLKDIIADIDLVLIMSVNPGFGGQSFIQHSITKIKELKTLINETNSSAKIEVDGGVSLKNAGEIIQAGADILVVGNAIFASENPKETIEKLKSL